MNMTRVDSMWNSATTMEARLQEGRETTHWIYNLATEGVAHVTLGGTGGGEMMVVGGKVMLTNDVVFGTRNELDVFDNAMLDQQFVLRLLEAAFPQGPNAIVGSQLVSASDAGQDLRMETTNTARVFSPPWSLRAQVTRKTPDTLGFALAFDGQRTGQRVHIEIDGSWTQQIAAKRLTDDFRLENWRAYRIRLGTRQVAGLTTAGWVAMPDARRYRTLGEARAVAGQVR